MASRTVSEWTKYSESFQNSLKTGDLLEFNEGNYSHWGMYYVDGLVVHLNPAKSTPPPGDRDQEMDRPDPKTFQPGKVTSDPVQVVAADLDIRVNNKPGHPGQVRDVKESIELMKTLVDAPHIDFCRAYFHCEIFAKFLKFQPIFSNTEQQGVVASAAILDSKMGEELCKIFKGQDKPIVYGKLAELQWWENVTKIKNKETPTRLLETGIREWAKAIK